MRKSRGKTEGSIAYLMDASLKKVGSKMQAWHGGELNGVSARNVMEESSEEFFNLLEKDFDANKHADCKLTKQDISEMLNNYKLMYTELGSCFSYLRQILPSEEDLVKLKDSIENARKL